MSTTIAYDGLNRRTSMTRTVAGIATTTRYNWCGQTLCQARDTDPPQSNCPRLAASRILAKSPP